MNEKMEEPLKTILKEQCKRVKAPFSKMDFKKPLWWEDYSWTEAEQEDFREWLVKFLMTDKVARKKWGSGLLTKRFVEDSVSWYLLDVGWKLK